VTEEVVVFAGKGAGYDSGSGSGPGEGEGAVLRGGGLVAALLPFLASFLFFFKFLFFSSDIGFVLSHPMIADVLL